MLNIFKYIHKIMMMIYSIQWYSKLKPIKVGPSFLWEIGNGSEIIPKSTEKYLHKKNY